MTTKEEGQLNSGIEIQANAFLDEKAWYNTRLKKWVNHNYFSRTKFKELRPYWIYINLWGKQALHTHPNNYQHFVNQLNKNQPR